MTTRLNPYLSFKDTTRQAMQFYQSVFGGKLEMNTFGEYQMGQTPAENELIMHAQLETDSGLIFMASDTPANVEYRAGANISMSLSGDDESTLRGYFDKLAAGGQITMPLEKSPWNDYFGMVTDQFGIQWMVNISTSQDQPS